MSSLTRIRSHEVAEPPPGVFSQCLVADQMIFLAGQHAGTNDGGVGGDGTMLSQATITLGKIKALIEAAGGTMADVVKLTIFVTDISKFAEIGEARRKYFTGDFPCATLIEIKALVDPGYLVEIDAIAINRKDRG